MKLDRNKNADGRGKYALIQMRELSEVKSAQILNNAGDDSEVITIPANSIRTGKEVNGQFFVLKYSDIFTIHALNAYAMAVRAEAEEMPECDERRSLMEYAAEVFAEAELARSAAVKIPD